MEPIGIEAIGIPPYAGLEICHEDVVYSYFRTAFTARGYSFKVKRSGFREIDAILRSGKGQKHGRGSCDGYIFSGSGYESFSGLVELESTGNLAQGISQVKAYVKSFTAKTLPEELSHSVERLIQRKPILIVFDGRLVWAAHYDLDTGDFAILLDQVDLTKDRSGVTAKLFSALPPSSARSRTFDERSLVEKVA